MAKYSAEELDNVYHSLANSTRRRIITRLCKEKSLTVTELAEPFDMSLAAVSKHIKVLSKTGLIRKTREGSTFRCHLEFEPIKSAAALIHYLENFIEIEEALTLDTPVNQEYEAEEKAEATA